jgi:hypothetical protein
MFQVTMTLARETKRTYRFEAEHHLLDVLYIQKAAFPAGAPAAIRVTVKEDKDA